MTRGIEPLSAMLATKWQERKDYVLQAVKSGSLPKLYCCPKYDGIRCVGSTQGLFSRNSIQFQSCDHVHKDIQVFIRALRAFCPHGDIHLDGELYFSGPNLPFERIVSAVKKTHKHATAEDYKLQKQIKFHLFDFTILNDPGKHPYVQRQYYLQETVKRHKKNFPSITLVPVRSFRTQEELETHLDEYLDRGMEGVIVRTPIGRYEPGKRSGDLMKYVPVMEEEFDVYDAKQGKGKFKGTLGSFVCVTSEGKKFCANPGVDEDMRRYWWTKRKELVGKKVTVRFQRYTAAGIPRFPSAKSIRNFMRMRV